MCSRRPPSCADRNPPVWSRHDNREPSARLRVRRRAPRPDRPGGNRPPSRPGPGHSDRRVAARDRQPLQPPPHLGTPKDATRMSHSAHDEYVNRTFGLDPAARRNAGPHAPKPRVDQRLARAEDNIRGTTKSIIGVVGAQLLQKQYDDMLTGLERARAARLTDIDGWAPDQTPVGGDLLIKICTGPAGLAKSAFPEVAFLDIAQKGLGAVVKGKEVLERGVEPSKQELEA